MNRVVVLLSLLLLPVMGFSQVLLESTDGEELLQNTIGITNSSVIGNFNISEQSAQFKAIVVLPHDGIIPNQYFTFGLKAKPTNGVSTLFSGGKLNPGTNLNMSYTKMNLFSNIMSNFVDYVSVRADYNLNRFTVFNPDNSYADQFENFNFHGGGIAVNYNNLYAGKHLFTVSLGYHYLNNYLQLAKVDIRDYKTVHDGDSNASREYGKTVSGRMGKYRTYQAMPVHVGYTLTPSEYAEEQEDIKLGFTVYYRSELAVSKPLHNVGAVFFLTKQKSDTGVRIPYVGVGFQLNDLAGSHSHHKSITGRMAFNLTTAFNLTSF